MAIGTPVPKEDLHPDVFQSSNIVPAVELTNAPTEPNAPEDTLHAEKSYPYLGAGAALGAQGLGRTVGSKNWFNSDFPEYRPSEPNPLPKNPGEFTDGTYKPGSPYIPGVYAPGKPYAPGPEFVRREFPGLPAELDKGPNAVENFALSQHKGPAGEGQFFGGQDYGDAYARAMEAKQFNAGSTGFVVPQGGTPLALPPEIAAQKEQEYKAKLEAERAQREEGARVIHEQQEDKRQAEHNRAEAARRQAHEDREAHRLKTFNDIERQRRDNHAAMEQEKQNRFLTSESERQGAHASRQAEYQLARRAEDARMAQEANQIAKSKLIGMANKLPGQIPLAGWNAGEAAERFQEPGIRNKIAGAVNAAGAVAPFLSHVPKIGKYAGLIGPGAAGLAHLIADEPQGHKAGGHIQHFGRGGQPDQGGPMTADRVINDVKSFGEPLTALGDTLASGLRSSTAATLGGLPDLYNLASAATGDRLGHAPYGSEELKQMFPEVTNDPERMNSNLVKMASAAGDWTPLAGPGEIARGIKGVGKLAGSEINKAMMGEGNSMLRAVTPQPMFAAPTSRTSEVNEVAPWVKKRMQTVTDPFRMAFPGIYKRPDVIAAEAAARVAPENPALSRLFGVTRDDLYQMGKNRVGNVPGVLPGAAANPKGSASATGVMNKRNANRIVDVLGESEKYPELVKGMDPWYIMDPAFNRLKELVGPEEAINQYNQLNHLTGMASPGSNVLTEMNRGTAANYLANQGRFDDFLKYAGKSNNPRAPADMQSILGHPYHRTAQGKPMQQYLETGSIQMKSPKVPVYIQSSGVPETGFQTDIPVGDAHWSRAVGLADTRGGKSSYGASVSNPEMAQLAPWWRDKIAARVGLESVPAQARAWGAFSPQTGVDSPIGAPKLELLAGKIMETADRMGITPEAARDMVLTGKAYAGKKEGGLAHLGAA